MQPLWKLVMSWNKCNQKCLSRHFPALKPWPICFNALYYWFSWGCTLQGPAIKTDKHKPKTRHSLNFSRPDFVFPCVLPVKYLWEGSKEGWENKMLDDQIVFLNRRKPQVLTRQICSRSPGMARGSWRGLAVQLTMRCRGQGCGPAQPLLRQLPQHALHAAWYKTGGEHVHPPTHTPGSTNNLLCWLEAGFAEFFKFLFFFSQLEKILFFNRKDVIEIQIVSVHPKWGVSEALGRYFYPYEEK